MLNEDDSNIRIAKVDCTTDNNVCSQHDVTGYPTLKFFSPGSAEGVRFKGTRDLPSLTNFINEQLRSVDEDKTIISIPETTSGLIDLTEDTFDKHVAEGKHFVKFYAPWCGHCQKLAPLWEQLSQSFQSDDTVSIAKVDCTQYRSVCNNFDVKGYPTLLWIEDGKKVDKYQGERTHEDLKAYVSNRLGDGKSSQEEKKSAVTTESAVVIFNGETFENGIGKGVSFVKFFAPW